MVRIRDLPEELVCLILGSSRNAARLCVQSKFFSNLFTIIQHLDLDYSRTPFTGRFSNYVHTVVSSLPKSSTRVGKFTLRSKIVLLHVSINESLRRVLNFGVVDLELSINCKHGYTLPLDLFTCKTLVKLRLGGIKFTICDVPENASLPKLESLTLDLVKFDNSEDCAFQRLLGACPVIEELIIDDVNWESWNWSRVLSSKSLKRLTVGRTLSDDIDYPDYHEITFDTPSLEYFEFADFIADAYPVVNFDSLVKAVLNLRLLVNHQGGHGMVYEHEPISSNPTNLFYGMRHVNILELSSPECYDIFYVCRNAIPVFEKLHHLTFSHDDSGFCWKFLPFLLQKSPNLKTLVIQGCLHFDDNEDAADVCACLDEYSCLLTCPVETLEITLWFNGTDEELVQVEYFLETLPRLELLKVHFHKFIRAEDKLDITTHLQGLPRASPRCEIEFIGHL